MSNKNRNRSNNGGRRFNMPQDVTDFAKASLKKYKKTVSKDPWVDTDKKTIKKGYFEYLLGMLPEVTKVMVFYGNDPAVKDIQPSVYEKLMSPDFVKRLGKLIDDEGKEAFENADIYPIVVNNMIRTAKEWTKVISSDEGTENLYVDSADLVDLQMTLLKKRLKKMKKANVPEGIAFDTLCVLPKASLLERSAGYWLRQVFNVLYEHAKTTKEIPFEKIVEILITEEFYPSLITALLLERKEIYVQMNDQQKEFFNACTEWLFNALENMNKSEIYEILKSYAEVRKRDKAQNRDGNRRFFLSSLPESDFPKICKILEKLQYDYDWVKEFI